VVESVVLVQNHSIGKPIILCVGPILQIFVDKVVACCVGQCSETFLDNIPTFSESLREEFLEKHSEFSVKDHLCLLSTLGCFLFVSLVDLSKFESSIRNKVHHESSIVLCLGILEFAQEHSVHFMHPFDDLDEQFSML